jgi:hypothetical protein
MNGTTGLYFYSCEVNGFIRNIPRLEELLNLKVKIN